jgi:hypothetical protein
VLLSDAALAKIIADYEAKLAAEKLAHEKTRRESDAKLESQTAKCKIKVDGEALKTSIIEAGCQRQLAICDKALSKASVSVPFYRAPYFNGVLGCAVCGGLCAGVSAAASRR